MDDILSLIQFGSTVTKGGPKFMEIADRLRRAITPTKSFPGVIRHLTEHLDSIISILTTFSDIVYKNINEFSSDHIIRAVDSYAIASIACVEKYLNTQRHRDIEDAVNCMRLATSCCVKYCPKNLYYYGSYSYNIASVLFKKKMREEALDFVNGAISIYKKTKQTDKLPLAFKIKTLCMLSLSQTDSDEFEEAIMNSQNSNEYLITWAGQRTPLSPAPVLRCVGSKEALYKLTPFFALHGDFSVIKKFKVYERFYPNFDPPADDSLFEMPPGFFDKFKDCYNLYKNRRFLECSKLCEKFCSRFERKKDTLGTSFTLFFIHHWLINSFFMIGRPDSAFFYTKQMMKFFKRFPFAAGLAAFYNLKACIHTGDYSRYKNPPKMEFDSIVDWGSVYCFYEAMTRNQMEEAFSYYDYILDSNNVIVQRESFHYHVGALRLYDFAPIFEDYEKACRTSNDSWAAFLYHQAIQKLQYENIDSFWVKEPMSVKKSVIELIEDAEKLAVGNSSLLRKIRLLYAIVIGRNDPILCAKILCKSVSTSVDHYVHSKSSSFSIPFSLVIVVYFNVFGLDPCLLFAVFSKSSEPFVVRIKTGDAVSDALDELEEIQNASKKLEGISERKLWWEKKEALDKRLQELLANFEENVLGIWAGILTPFKYKHSMNAYKSVLTTHLLKLSEREQREFIRYCHNELGENITPNNSPVDISPVTLILGKYIQRLPWEMLPSVVKNRVIVTRCPSMKLFSQLCERSIPSRVDARSSFYVLNPEGDLERTQERIKPILAKMRFDGITHQIPEQELIEKKLEKVDLYVYCGHGNGNEYFRYSRLVDENLPCRSSLLLMGCSSGLLDDNGELDPIGAPNYCIAAGAPSVVGTLWNVTDGDIDRFFVAVLKDAKERGETRVEEAVINARAKCKLPYLTGAAVVVYGMPTVIKMP